MPSARYNLLVERIANLQRSLLPATSETGEYSDEDRDRTLGFRVLAHAEIEAFLEERTLEVAVDAKSRWEKDRATSRPLMSLIAFHPNKVGGRRDLKDELERRKTRADDCVAAACKAFSFTVSKNNGVREENVLKLLFPIGVLAHQINTTWLNTIDSFGARRGAAAHSSVRAVERIDPNIEKQQVEQVLQGLEEVDGILSELGA